MIFRILSLFVAVILAGCVTSGPAPEAIASAEKRELTAIEKTALTSALAQSMKDPSAAQFKWMPVTLITRGEIVDYCGLVNGRNSYGGYVGFQKFYAQLVKNEKDEFLRGTLRLIASDEVSTIATNGACDRYGYLNFSLAR